MADAEWAGLKLLALWCSSGKTVAVERNLAGVAQAQFVLGWSSRSRMNHLVEMAGVPIPCGYDGALSYPSSLAEKPWNFAATAAAAASGVEESPEIGLQ